MEDRTVCEAAKERRCLCASSKDLVRREDLTGQAEQAFPNLMPLMNTAFVPGKCLEYIRGMKKGPKKDIAFAEYHYFSGHPREAAQETEMYLTCGDPELRLSACLIYAYSNLSVGQIQRARYGLEEIEDTLKADTERTPHARSIEGFISAAAAVLLHLPLPEELPDTREFMPLLPAGLRAFALYVQAHYLYLQKKYEHSIGIIEAALTMGGMLEAVVKQRWPEDFKRIIAITYGFSSGWRKIHNPETGHDVADDLTTTEFATAMLAARGWTNPEIGEHMNISVNTVKHHISQAMKKLHIESRKDLKKYMLK